MLIICPKCFAKYEIDTNQFNEETHIFQCSNCGKRFEERIHFDDEKNENQQSVPPAFITEQPILAPLSENDYISSNRANMDFTPQSSVVLPEEFTPVGDVGSSTGRKIAFVIMLLCVLGLVGASAYVWMNKASIMKKYPEIQRAINLIATPAKPVLSSVSQEDLPMEGDSPAMPQPQEVILTPIEEKMQEDDPNSGDINDRILPVETEAVIYPKPSVSNDEVAQPSAEHPIQPIEQPVPEVKPAVEENVVPEMPVVPSETLEPGVPEVVPQVAPAVEPELPAEEEIILEDISLPDGIIVPALAQPKTEPNVSPADIQIRDVSFKYDQADTEPRLFVQGVIANITDRVIQMPPLQVQLFDANGTLLGVKELPYGEAQMPPKSDEFFFYELTDVPAGTVAKIEIMVKG